MELLCSFDQSNPKMYMFYIYVLYICSIYVLHTEMQGYYNKFKYWNLKRLLKIDQSNPVSWVPELHRLRKIEWWISRIFTEPSNQITWFLQASSMWNSDGFFYINLLFINDSKYSLISYIKEIFEKILHF